jgi:hypothetical protein
MSSSLTCACHNVRLQTVVHFWPRPSISIVRSAAGIPGSGFGRSEPGDFSTARNRQKCSTGVSVKRLRIGHFRMVLGGSTLFHGERETRPFIETTYSGAQISVTPLEEILWFKHWRKCSWLFMTNRTKHDRSMLMSRVRPMHPRVRPEGFRQQCRIRPGGCCVGRTPRSILAPCSDGLSVVLPNEVIMQLLPDLGWRRHCASEQ